MVTVCLLLQTLSVPSSWTGQVSGGCKVRKDNDGKCMFSDSVVICTDRCVVPQEWDLSSDCVRDTVSTAASAGGGEVTHRAPVSQNPDSWTCRAGDQEGTNWIYSIIKSIRSDILEMSLFCSCLHLNPGNKEKKMRLKREIRSRLEIVENKPHQPWIVSPCWALHVE